MVYIRFMINENNIMTAPVATNVSTLLAKYKELHPDTTMTLDSFYYFITEPSVQREQFLLELTSSPSVNSSGIILNSYAV
jgi:hypothetical protein